MRAVYKRASEAREFHHKSAQPKHAPLISIFQGNTIFEMVKDEIAQPFREKGNLSRCRKVIPPTWW